MVHILAVDDEPDVLDAIRQVLEDADLEVTGTSSGSEALALLASTPFDLVVLDIIMPEMSGIEVCRRIRATPSLAKIPVLFLTAKGRPDDIAQGLDTGADDYLTKPFEVVELPARIRALLRRAPSGTLDPESDHLVCGDIRLSTERLEAEVRGDTVDLTPTEHRLLHCLMIHHGRPVSTEQLLEDVWEYPPGVGDPRLVRVHITNLRAKLQPDEDGPQYVMNVHGKGYLVTC